MNIKQLLTLTLLFGVALYTGAATAEANAGDTINGVGNGLIARFVAQQYYGWTGNKDGTLVTAALIEQMLTLAQGYTEYNEALGYNWAGAVASYLLSTWIIPMDTAYVEVTVPTGVDVSVEKTRVGFDVPAPDCYTSSVAR